jgi:hypothetical protein
MGPERQSARQLKEQDCTIAGFGFSNSKSNYTLPRFAEQRIEIELGSVCLRSLLNWPKVDICFYAPLASERF